MATRYGWSKNSNREPSLNLVSTMERLMTQQHQLADFVARLCLVLLFPFSALNEIFDYHTAMVQAAHGWIPLPPALAVLLLTLGGLLEVFGTVCILLNFC